MNASCNSNEHGAPFATACPPCETRWRDAAVDIQSLREYLLYSFCWNWKKNRLRRLDSNEQRRQSATIAQRNHFYWSDSNWLKSYWNGKAIHLILYKLCSDSCKPIMWTTDIGGYGIGVHQWPSVHTPIIGVYTNRLNTPLWHFWTSLYSSLYSPMKIGACMKLWHTRILTSVYISVILVTYFRPSTRVFCCCCYCFR